MRILLWRLASILTLLSPLYLGRLKLVYTAAVLGYAVGIGEEIGDSRGLGG